MKQFKSIKLLVCLAAAGLISVQAHAHTGVRDQAKVDSVSYNGFTITHGCGAENGDAYPVIGQAALFPMGNYVVWRDENGAVLAEGGGAGIFDTIVLDHTGAPLPDEGLNLQVTGYAGSSSGFATTEEIVNQDGVVQGLLWKDGVMAPNLNSITPFKVTIPKIIDHCVKQVKIRIGVINYCDKGKNAANDAKGPYAQPKDNNGRAIPQVSAIARGAIQRNAANSPAYQTMANGNGDNNRADWWFTKPYKGSKMYADPQLLQPTYWTTMTVNNTEEHMVQCPSFNYKTVSVEPTGAAFDRFLNGANTRPFTAGNGNL